MDKTTLLVLMYSVLILNMTYIARIHPEAPCTVFFEEDDMEGTLLRCEQNKKGTAKTL